MVRPIASPAIDLNVPRASAAVAKTTQTRKNVRTASTAKPAPSPICSEPDLLVERRRAEPARVGDLVRVDPPEADGSERRPDELREPVDERKPGLDAPRNEEAERDRRIEVTARDVADGRDHDGDGEAVGKRHADEVGSRHDGAGAGEDESERADQLGDGAAGGVGLHCGGG
jgi:hypothetical protein